MDDFLLRELRRSRSGRMRDIVETIRRDQMALVTGSPADVLVIQGGPGTGKSAVGLHRVTWLVDNDHFRPEDILVVGPHASFLEYVGRVLPTLGTRNVTAVQLSRLWDGEIRGTDSAQARRVKSDGRMAGVLRRRVESECRPEALDALTTAPSDERDEPAFTVVVGSTTLRVPRSEMLNLLGEARAGAGAYRVRRNRFRDQLVDRLLRALAETGARRGLDSTVRRDLERNRQVTALVERTWPQLSPEEALRSLLDSPDKLRECASDVLDDEEQAALRRPRADRAAEDPWTLDDLVCLEELRFLLADDTPKRYRHIVVDEAQDLTPMQARSLRRRCPTGSMTVLGDLAQATGPHPYTEWTPLGGLLADRGAWQVAELNTSYRVPAEIMDFVAPLARAIAPSLPYPVAVRRAGGEAVRVVPTTPEQLLDEVVRRTALLTGTDEQQHRRSIAVIVPAGAPWLDELRERVAGPGALGPDGQPVASVLVTAQAKGMEFDHVLVLEPAAITDDGPTGLRRLYVALTRSTQTLTVLHTAPLPPALAGGGPGPLGQPVALPVGSTVRVRVLGPGAGPRLKVQALSPATDRALFLVQHHGSRPPTARTVLDAWVVHHEPRATLLSAGDFGRRPVSVGMAPRYAAALGVLGELAGGGALPHDAAARLSELKGMANRCLRRDQADWLSVWQLLGSPGTARLQILRDLARDTREAVVPGSTGPGAGLAAGPASELASELARSGWADALADAAQRLARTPAPAVEPAVEPDVQPAAETAFEPGTETGTETDEKEAAPVPETVTPADQRPAPSDSLVAELTAAVGTERNCNTHEAVRLELMAALFRAGLRPSDSPIADVSRLGEDGLFLYEVLGPDLVTYPDLRAGAVRLLEVDHASAAKAARRYLVLSGPPAQEWVADVVLEVFGVHLLWRTPDGWGGADKETALGPGSSAAGRVS